MRLAEYCRGESGFLLLPIEHLSPEGSDAELAAFLTNDCGWSGQRVALLNAALALYWSRSRALADKTGAWPHPRIRNIGIADDVAALRPYAQVLNTSTWSLYDGDLDPTLSNAELVAYLLALGDWMALTGEVTQAPVLSASWWLEADDSACESFTKAAKRSTRADGDCLRAVARALPWLTNLRQRDIRPADSDEVVREIPGTGLQVPARHEAKPPRLVKACQQAAEAAIEAYRRAWPSRDTAALGELAGWLDQSSPLVVVTGTDGATLWDRSEPQQTETLVTALDGADGVAVASIHADLALIDTHSQRFLAALSDPDGLGGVGDRSLGSLSDDSLAEGGYAYVHPTRRIIAYNLFEPGMERLSGPPLPFERAMLGARVWHEWAHLADTAGCVGVGVDDDRLSELRAELAEQFAGAIEECDASAADTALADLTDLCAGRSSGDALVGLLLARLPDYRANLIARAFMSAAERETYARHNIRTLHNDYAPAQLWRATVRYLYEYQYLLPGVGLTAIDDPYRYFAMSTGFASDFVATGAMSTARFTALATALSKVLGVYVVDTDSITLPIEEL